MVFRCLLFLIRIIPWNIERNTGNNFIANVKGGKYDSRFSKVVRDLDILFAGYSGLIF